MDNYSTVLIAPRFVVGDIEFNLSRAAVDWLFFEAVEVSVQREETRLFKSLSSSSGEWIFLR
jgi:hypothetical protein